MKKRLHLQIALVGGQPTPVYQGIVHTRPDQIILICSGQTEKVAIGIREQLPFYKDKDVMINKISDTDMDSMYQAIDGIEQAQPKGITLSLNLSSGLKVWTVIFYALFRRKRRSCHTFAIGQDGSFFDFKDKKTNGKVAFDMDAQFKVLGHQIDECSLLSDYTKDDLSVMYSILNLAKSVKYSHFSKITAIFADEYKREYNHDRLRQDYEAIFKLNTLCWYAEDHLFECTLGNDNYTFASPHVEKIVLNTGWFELYVANLVAQIYGEENVRLNCVFRNVNNSPKNEIDIIANTGSKLIFVECKTQIFDTTDIDKFRSAVRNYGGLGSKPLFVTFFPMKPEGQEKCQDHRIDVFCINNPKYNNQTEMVEAFRVLLKDVNEKWNV